MTTERAIQPRRTPALPGAVLATLSGATFTVAAFTLAATPALAQQSSEDSFVFVTPDADVADAPRTHDGMLQLGGSLAVSNADYFRGRFDGVPDDFDELSVQPSARASLEFWRQGDNSATFTLGSSNSVWTEDVLPEDSTWGNWYESNNYAGLAATFGGFQTGVTYTRYGSPNDTFDTAHELGASLGYGEPIAGLAGIDPTFTVAVPVHDDGRGAFTKLSANAISLTSESLGADMTFTVPVAVGVGWGDYYGKGSGTAGYAETGLDVGLPLDQAGRWSLNAGVHAIARQDDIADRDPALAGNDTMAYQGMLSLDFTY